MVIRMERESERDGVSGIEMEKEKGCKKKDINMDIMHNIHWLL